MTARRAVRASFALLVAALAGPLLAAPAQAESWSPITGSGSTWSSQAVQTWKANVAANYGMQVNFTDNGSSAGRQDFIAKRVDFAISEIPFQAVPEDGSAPEAPTTPYAYMPIVAGGTSFMYNLKIGGKQVTNLRMSGEVIVKIFTGVITKWNDAQIQADNPGLALPDRAITPVVRSDGSGTTAQFTLWMSSQYPQLWSDYCAKLQIPQNHCGMTSQYPGSFKSQAQSTGVAGYVAMNSSEGSITYVEFSYAAVLKGFPVVKVLNAAGYYVEPTAQNVAVALQAAKIHTEDPKADNYLTQDLSQVYANPDKRAYPLSSYSYLILPTAVVSGSNFNTDHGRTLGAFANYVICEGQQSAEAMGYSPLPMNLVQAGADQIKRIPGAGAVDISACNNPTFKPGDSPTTNQLALTAPDPEPCDMKGPDQCTTPTGGVPGSYFTTHSAAGANGGTKDDTGNKDSTNNNGTKSSSTKNGGSGAKASGTSGQGGTGQDLAATGDSPGTDENGNPLSSDDGSGALGDLVLAGGDAAAASPFTLPSAGAGWLPWVMGGAAVLFLAIVALPPMLSRRLRASGGVGTDSRR